MSKIYALYGKSGTGKSHRAISIAFNYNIPLIIDDGLLIYKGKKIPGSISGKQEQNRIRAVKRAIFDDNDYAQKMSARLQALNPSKILIIGTSQHMINKIIQNLKLDQPDHWIDISEITSTRERKKAKYHRDRGRHVVPLSPVEVRKTFKVPLLDRLKLLIPNRGKTEYLGEQSVVKPNFHSLGGIYIKEKALEDMAYFALHHDLTDHDVKQIKTIKITNSAQSTSIEIHLKLGYDNPLHLTAKSLQADLQDKIKKLSGLDSLTIKIIISEIDVPDRFK
ncbi:hypothetical protein [Natranaerobius thermophilus]|uniref:Uncharacterized protein n=1 Tax=Natranaerobius thermophilus (strain ATCC BAA-1301 / DSM 18059 / JW/NM-WN-LF) TaxID=457570 RepID=B2A5R6_NATTJ|nr:hypothetical protein [Natranaerobius thermophilus]ACB84009.1 conserved hypothetical protein [Natranaerobius thermophilus JW/NM-WN-LF]